MDTSNHSQFKKGDSALDGAIGTFVREEKLSPAENWLHSAFLVFAWLLILKGCFVYQAPGCGPDKSANTGNVVAVAAEPTAEVND